MKLSIPLILLTIALSCFELSAQRIRKDHMEMTPSEKNAYVMALNNKVEAINGLADRHADHFASEIHTGEALHPRTQEVISFTNGTQFLPWHRVFQLEFEQVLRTAETDNASSVTVPYWDWRKEYNSTDIQWDDRGFLEAATLDLNPSRQFDNTIAVATAEDINILLAKTGTVIPPSQSTFIAVSETSRFFSKVLEYWHNRGHRFIGGTMMEQNSPADPLFFLHHGFIDKLWQDWEDKEDAIKSQFDYTSLLDHYHMIDPNNIIDSRKTQYSSHDDHTIFEVDVWYAYNKKLLLDGLAGNFNVTSSKVYTYTAWNASTQKVEGSIFAGDVKRDANDNVITDTKGGFVVKSGADCKFKAGKEIVLKQGFIAEAGSLFGAQIISAPEGFSSNLRYSYDDWNDHSSFNANGSKLEAKCYPNPFSSELKLEFYLIKSSSFNYKVYDNMGNVVLNKSSENQEFSGKRIETINTTDLVEGIYILELRSNSETIRMKIIK